LALQWRLSKGRASTKKGARKVIHCPMGRIRRTQVFPEGALLSYHGHTSDPSGIRAILCQSPREDYPQDLQWMQLDH
jgi:hypothetical protein